MQALLDVNLLVALHDGEHVNHGHAVDWLDVHADQGWASCPLTQNGCLRVLSQPTYQRSRPMIDVWTALEQTFYAPSHAFWSDDLSLFDPTRIDRDRIHGHRQLTDVYLLALAVRHRGRFVTLDERIPLDAVRGAEPRHLLVLGGRARP